MQRVFLVLLIASFFLFSFDRVFNLDPIKDAVQFVLSPVSYAMYTIGLQTSQGVSFVVSIPQIYSENVELKNEATVLNKSLVELDSLRKENDALRAQLGVQGGSETRKVLASVLGLLEYGNSVVLMVDAGEMAGVRTGAIAFTSNTVVGQVIKVTQYNAYILPIFAVDSKIPAEVVPSETTELLGTRVRGLVEGHFNNKVILSEVLQKDVLELNDIVVTSGEGGVFAPGMLLGKVARLESNDSQVFRTAELEPYWELSQLRTVFINALE